MNNNPINLTATIAITLWTLLNVAGPTTANASSFLSGQDSRLQKCVRAILGGYEEKHVEIFGRKYNCKSMKTLSNGRRRIQISHHHFAGKDDQFYASFRVDSRNVVVPGSFSIKEKKGIAIQNALPFEFHGNATPPKTYADFASAADAARRNLKNWRNAGKVKWYKTANIVVLVAIAELGNPENRGTAPVQVDCKRPSFYAHDNFAGRRYQPDTGSYPNIHKLTSFQGLGDNMSSACVPRGYVVHLFEHSDYKGKMWEIVGPRQFYDFKRQKRAFHDNISAIRIFENTEITGN